MLLIPHQYQIIFKQWHFQVKAIMHHHNMVTSMTPGVGVIKPISSVPLFSSFSIIVKTSVGNSHRSAGPRPTTLEEGWELFVDFSSILCLWFEIQGMLTYNFFDWVSNTGQNKHYLFNITSIFGRCRRSSAAGTPAKYECYSRNPTGTFARSNILLTEKLANEALVTPTPEH